MTLVAVVTGASSGIGEATAWRLAREPGAQLILVARREERLRRLAGALPVPATWVAADLTDPDAPAEVASHVAEHHKRLTLLVNNAGARWHATFADGGYANLRRTMDVNFDSAVRLTEALLPMLRASAPSAIVNVASRWTDALYLEERPNGVHVGLVLPGYIATEGFPAHELREKALTRWTVSDAAKAADAIADAALHGRAERYVPRPYAVLAVARVLAPGLLRRLQASRAGALATTRTGADAAGR